MPPRGGGIQTTTKSNAQAIQNNLRDNGVQSTLEKKKNGDWIINYVLSFTQLVNGLSLIKSLKRDKNVDDKDMEIDDSIAARVVDVDVKLAMKQVPNVKFSYIDNKIRPEKGLQELAEYKVKDLDTMDDFFERVDPSSMSQSRNNQSIDDYKQLYNGNDEIEKWWFTQTQTLKDNIEIQFTDFEEEYELVGINLLYNSKHATKYLQHKGYENSVLMFHGAKQTDMGSIFQTGFQMSPQSIGKLYGKGHYFTLQAIHAIRYLSKCKGYADSNEFTVIAAFVNPGKVKEVNDCRYNRKPMAKGYDSHHVQVTDGVGCAIGHPVFQKDTYKGDVMDEYAIKDSTRILPRFYITLKRVDKIVIWRDKNIANQFNATVLKQLKGNTAVYGVKDTKTALDLVKKKMQKNEVYVITNGAHDGEGFVRKVRKNLGLETDILVFCSAVDWHSKWAKKFQNIQVKSGKSNIISFIDNH